MSDKDRYLYLIGISAVTVFAALIGNILTNSFSLISVGLHMLADIVPLAFGYVLTVKRADGKGTSTEEAVLSSINIALLFVIGAVIATEAHRRIEHPQPVGAYAFVFGAIDFVLSALIAYLSKGLRYAHNHLHTYLGQILHQVVDFLSSGAVLLGLIILALTGMSIADTIASFCVAAASLIAGALVFVALFYEPAHDHTDH